MIVPATLAVWLVIAASTRWIATLWGFRCTLAIMLIALALALARGCIRLRCADGMAAGLRQFDTAALTLIVALVPLIWPESTLGLVPMHVPSRSMTPTLQPGDIIAVDTWHYAFAKPVPGDVAVFADFGKRRLLVKRLVAVRGGSIDAAGDNPTASVPAAALQRVPGSNLRGRVAFIVTGPARALGSAVDHAMPRQN